MGTQSVQGTADTVLLCGCRPQNLQVRELRPIDGGLATEHTRHIASIRLLDQDYGRAIPTSVQYLYQRYCKPVSCILRLDFVLCISTTASFLPDIAIVSP